MNERCDQCKYGKHKEDLGDDVRKCIVNPPRIIAGGDGKPASYYPVVSGDYFCRFFSRVDAKTGDLIRVKDIKKAAVAPNLR